MSSLRHSVTVHYLTAALLIGVWVAAVAGWAQSLPLHVASWLTFLALLITPGYLLGDIVAWRLRLDGLERLALALPLGVTVLALPGTAALLQHLTLSDLAFYWTIASGAVIVVWLLHQLRIARQRPQDADPWRSDELLLLGLIIVAFIAIFPTLSLYKIDGDAYAVNSFVADAVAGLPLNAREPLFGTDLGPGVRMVFNQSLSLNYLWVYFSGIDANTLVAAASKTMLALWAILAAYMLGKAAGKGSRRFGLLVAAVQLLIYVAAPFIRGDNVSLFFFERINADKFMVPVTMLPVVFALAITFVREGAWRAWLAAALATVAVSTIHPLIAAMLALALGGFAAVHLLMNLRRRTAWLRVVGLAGLVVIVMSLPLVQLVLSRSEAPLASSYPSSFDGWSVGEKQVPVLPFVHVRSLDYYGPLPRMADLEAADAYESDNPFLVWRFALNMDRRRLLLFDLNNYISDPSLVMEPPYFLALLLLPMFFWRLRRDEEVQFVIGVSLAVLFVMFNPLLTPLIGSFVMPWILWRFVWILPYALVLALAAQQIITAVARLSGQVRLQWTAAQRDDVSQWLGQYLPLVFVLLATLLLMPGIMRNVRNLNGRIAFAYEYPTPHALFDRLNAATADEAAVVLADPDLSVTIPAFVARASIVAHRAPTTSEIFPADAQDVALQRLLDQYDFFAGTLLTRTHLDILARYDVDYVAAKSGGDLDVQLRLSPQWFTWLVDDEGYSLYALAQRPQVNETIRGNTAMARREWDAAEAHYEAALRQNSDDLVARVGLAHLAQRRGEFDAALAYLDEALAISDQPILHFQLGQLYAAQGHIPESIAEFDAAQAQAPHIPRFHIALGDVCLSDGKERCAAVHYQAAVDQQTWRDPASRLIAEADLWQRRGVTARSLPLYEQAAALQPSEYNVFVLVGVYRELGRFQEAEAQLRSLRLLFPFSADIVVAEADLATAQGQYEQATGLLRHAIWLQELQVEESTDTHFALAQVLLAADRLDEAEREVAYAVSLQPLSATAHRLRGELFHAQDNLPAAVRAYEQAFELDPAQTGLFVALTNELRQSGSTPDEVMLLLQTALRVNANEATLLLTLGDQWQRLGNADAAIDAYQSAVEQLDPYARLNRLRSPADSRAFAFSRLAATYEDMGQMEAAMNCYTAAVAAAPESSWPYLLLGDAQRRRNDVEAAVASYETAIARDSANVDAYVRLADLFNAAGETERADPLYQRALELANPSTAESQERLTFVSWSEPLADLDPTLLSDETLLLANYAPPAPAEATVVDDTLWRTADHSEVHAMARLFQGRDQDDEAIALYRQRLSQGEAEGWSSAVLARYHKELGDLYLVRHELEAAVAAYEQAVALDHWWPEARLGLAEALTLQGDSQAAMGHLEAAVELAPGSVEAQIALANALDTQGKPTEAMTIYLNTVRRHPGNGRAALAVARAWQERDRDLLAERSFREAIAVSPGEADAYVGLAELRMDAGAYDEAETLLQTALSIDHNNVSSYIRRGELAQRRGDVGDALAWYQKAARLPAADQTLNLTLIDALVRYGDYTTALSYTQRALQQRPSDTELLLRRGRIERINGRYDEALATLTAAQAAAPDNSRLYGELATLYLDQGQVDAALAAYEQAIELNPTEAATYVSAAQLWAEQGQADFAMSLLSRGLTEVTDPAALYDTMSTLQLQQGRPEEALETLRAGFSDLGETTEMLLAMGAYYVNRANFVQVEERYSQALESQPDLADVHIALGDLHLLRGENDAAVAQYLEAIHLDPTNPSHHLALGSAYEESAQFDAAAAAYRQALVAAPTLVDAYLALAALYETQSRWDEAAAVYEEGLVAAPTSGELMTRLAALQLQQDNRAAALALLNRAADLSPTAATFTSRAALYVTLARNDEARADLERALALQPAAVETLVALGDLYKAEGDLASAESYYLRAVEAMPGVPTGYLRLAKMAREAENRDAVVYWNDLARQADPGGLARPDELARPAASAEEARPDNPAPPPATDAENSAGGADGE